MIYYNMAKKKYRSKKTMKRSKKTMKRSKKMLKRSKKKIKRPKKTMKRSKKTMKRSKNIMKKNKIGGMKFGRTGVFAKIRAKLKPNVSEARAGEEQGLKAMDDGGMKSDLPPPVTDGYLSPQDKPEPGPNLLKHQTISSAAMDVKAEEEEERKRKELLADTQRQQEEMKRVLAEMEEQKAKDARVATQREAERRQRKEQEQELDDKKLAEIAEKLWKMERKLARMMLQRQQIQVPAPMSQAGRKLAEDTERILRVNVGPPASSWEELRQRNEKFANDLDQNEQLQGEKINELLDTTRATIKKIKEYREGENERWAEAFPLVNFSAEEEEGLEEGSLGRRKNKI